MPELLADMLSSSTMYCIDSMPILVCCRVRAKRYTKIAGAPYDGVFCQKRTLFWVETPPCLLYIWHHDTVSFTPSSRT